MLLTKHEGETFRNQTVYISGQAFINCSFVACTLILRETVYHLQSCTFERCNWHVDWVLMWGSAESVREIKALVTLIEQAQQAQEQQAGGQPPEGTTEAGSGGARALAVRDLIAPRATIHPMKPHSPRPPRRPLAAWLAVALAASLMSVFAASPALAALRADQLALVVNSKVPEGKRLAEFYAQQRGVPAGRVLTLDLPDGDEVSYGKYNDEVVPAVRKFLKDNGLESQVTCLVTFYGVPLRIGRRPSTPAENEELNNVNNEWTRAVALARTAVGALEALAKEADAHFTPANADDTNGLPARADAAVQLVIRSLTAETDATRRGQRFTQLLGQIEALYGSLETIERLSHPSYANLAGRPLTQEQVVDARARFKRAADDLNLLAPDLNDARSRDKVRQIIRDNFGQFRYLKLLTDQKIRLTSDETHAAFDSELAAIWWPDDYPRFRWQMSPLYYKVRFPTGLPPIGAPTRPTPPQTLMVMRLDAPTPALVQNLITTCLRVEKEGLKGKVALDGRGRAPGDAYGQYDQSIRDLATLIKGKTRLDVRYDDTESLFAAPGSVKDVALYCGWYSLRKYVPGMTFNPGAVGFHVASLELLSLHVPTETGWCHGLLEDGVCGTLGAVAEPYLHSFPAADDFFPLLLTGKLTLAEVYWLSNPMVSWMNACIGDPLYTPYQANPALKHEDVPPRVHAIFE